MAIKVWLVSTVDMDWLCQSLNNIQRSQLFLIVASQSLLFIFFTQLQMFGKLLDTASLLKAKLAKDELDQALIEATNDDNWQASTTLLHEISSSAYNHQKWKKISDFVWDKLRNTKRWKKILKALNIVEFLLKNGPEYAVDQLKRERQFFRTMESFQAFDDGMDRGASIRQRARIVVSLLDREDMLQDERVRARQIRERMSHLAGSSSFNNQNPQKPNNSVANKYQSFSSASCKTSDDNNAFYNYGSGNYGDREENKHHRDDYFQHVSRKTEEPKRQEKEKEKEKQTKQAKKVVQNEPVARSNKVEPIVTLNLRNRTAQLRNGDQKPSYETLAQKLMKSKENTTTTPIVPDLSYKKKNAEDLLIDTEAYFVQHKYHFQEPIKHKEDNTYKPPSSPAKNGTNEPVIVQIVQPTPVAVPVPVPTLNLVDFDGLLFLGIQSTKNTTPAKPEKKVQIPPQVVVPPQPAQAVNTPITIPAPVSYSPIPNIAPMIPPVQPNPITMLPPYNNYSPYAYPTYPQQSYHNINSAPNPYNSNLPVSNIYSAPSYQYNQYYQPQTQTYNHQPTYLTNNTPAPSNSQPKGKQNQDEFGDFKNGGSFDIQKINWMSNKEKNLTDLTDFTIDVKDIPKGKVEKKKEFSNNIKIDPWAW